MPAKILPGLLQFPPTAPKHVRAARPTPVEDSGDTVVLGPDVSQGLAGSASAKLSGLSTLAERHSRNALMLAGGCPFGLLGVVATGLTPQGKQAPPGYVAIHSLGGAQAGEAFLAGDSALARCLCQQTLTQSFLGESGPRFQIFLARAG